MPKITGLSGQITVETDTGGRMSFGFQGPGPAAIGDVGEYIAAKSQIEISKLLGVDDSADKISQLSAALGKAHKDLDEFRDAATREIEAVKNEARQLAAGRRNHKKKA